MCRQNGIKYWQAKDYDSAVSTDILPATASRQAGIAITEYWICVISCTIATSNVTKRDFLVAALEL